MLSVNPATGAVIGEFEPMSYAAAEEVARRTATAAGRWRQEDLSRRARALTRLEELLTSEAGALARIMAQEMGKPIRDGVKEIEKCATACRYYALNAAAFLQQDVVATDATRSYVAFQPLGVVLAIMPWNFPFWQFFRCAAPALMAGNGVLLKHASNVSGCALAIERLFSDAGCPEDLVRVLLVQSKTALDLIDSEHVDAVTLTGSVEAGRAVAARAGNALKKTVLELGGSDPYVVLSDADLTLAADTCVMSRLINGGQSCIAAKRFIVVRDHRERFEHDVVARMEAVVPGDPSSADTRMGPLARQDLRDELHGQVRASIEKGATLLLGGEVPPAAGAWYPPTVLTDVVAGMPAFDEELFGPVAAITIAEDDDEAIAFANATSFGLGAAVFCGDSERGERIARDQLHAGCAFVNTHVRSDARLPFGGIRSSGYGRELGSYGLREFVNVKTVYVR